MLHLVATQWICKDSVFKWRSTTQINIKDVGIKMRKRKFLTQWMFFYILTFSFFDSYFSFICHEKLFCCYLWYFWIKKKRFFWPFHAVYKCIKFFIFFFWKNGVTEMLKSALNDDKRYLQQENQKSKLQHFRVYFCLVFSSLFYFHFDFNSDRSLLLHHYCGWICLRRFMIYFSVSLYSLLLLFFHHIFSIEKLFDFPP